MQKDDFINYLTEKGYNATKYNDVIKIKLPRSVVVLVEEDFSEIITIKFGHINRSWVIPSYSIMTIFLIILNVRSYSVDFMLFSIFAIVAGFVSLKKRFTDSNKLIKDMKDCQEKMGADQKRRDKPA